MGFFSTTRSDAAAKIQARQRGKSTRRRQVAEALEPLRAKAKAEAEKKEEEAANKVVEKLEKAYVRQVTDDPTAKFEEKGQVTEQMVEKAARGFGARFLLTLEVLASFAQNLVILFSLRLPWPEELVRWFSNLFGFLFFVPDLLGWMFDLIFLVAELLGALLDQLAVHFRQLLPSLSLPEPPAMPSGDDTFIPLAKWIAFSLVLYPLLVWLLVVAWRPTNALAAGSDSFSDGELVRVRGWWRSAWLGAVLQAWVGFAGFGFGAYHAIEEASTLALPSAALALLMLYAAFEHFVLPRLSRCYGPMAFECMFMPGEPPPTSSCIDRCCEERFFCRCTSQDGLRLDYPACFDFLTSWLVFAFTCGGRVQRVYSALASRLVTYLSEMVVIAPVRIGVALLLTQLLLLPSSSSAPPPPSSSAATWLLFCVLLAPRATLLGVTIGGAAEAFVLPAHHTNGVAFAVFLFCTSFPTALLAVALVALLVVYAARMVVLLCAMPAAALTGGEASQQEIGHQLMHFAIYLKSRLVLLLLTVLYLPVVQSLALAVVREHEPGGPPLCYRRAFPRDEDGEGGGVPGCDDGLGLAVDLVVVISLPVVALGVPLLLTRLAQAAAAEVTRRAAAAGTSSEDELRLQALAPVPLRCLPIVCGQHRLPPESLSIVVENRAIMSLIAPYELKFAWWKVRLHSIPFPTALCPCIPYR
jgi:hypothetical protein